MHKALIFDANGSGDQQERALHPHGAELAPVNAAPGLGVSGDYLATKNPHSGGVVACLERFGVANDLSLFVGDSSIDVAADRYAGVQVWALPYG